MCCAILLHYACTYSKTTSAIIEPTNAQARKVFKSIVNAIYETGILKSKNETFLTIELINGSTIMFKSAEVKDGLRGYTVSGCLIIDEAAYLSPDILPLVLPWTQVHKTPIMFVSTPRIKDGVFWNYWKEGIENNKNIISVDWTDWDTSALISQDMIEQYRRTLTSNQFRSEILGEWLDDEGLVFRFLKENTIPDTPGNYSKVFLGIDFGAGDNNDYTSISAFNERGEMVFLDYWNNLSTLQQIERLTNDIMSFGNTIVSANMENNSIGKPLIDLIIQSLNKNNQQITVSKINRWVTTNSSKGQLVNEFQVGLEQGEVKIFDNKMLLTQFSAYEAEFNPKTQTITYNGAYGTHDDLVMSTMLAWDAYKKYTINGMYTISVV